MAKPRRAKNAHTTDRFDTPRQFDDRTERRQALLDKAKTGSREALGDLFNDHVPILCSFFSRNMSAELAAETTPLDLVQEAFLKALKGFTKFIGGQAAQFTDWLMTICRNVLADWQRNYQRAGAYELTFGKPLGELELEGGEHGYGRRQVSPAEILAALETAGQLLAALARLPFYEQRIILWKVIQGLTFTEIAARLLLSDDAVQRSFKHGVVALRKRLALVGMA